MLKRFAKKKESMTQETALYDSEYYKECDVCYMVFTCEIEMGEHRRLHTQARLLTQKITLKGNERELTKVEYSCEEKFIKEGNDLVPKEGELLKDSVKVNER